MDVNGFSKVNFPSDIAGLMQGCFLTQGIIVTLEICFQLKYHKTYLSTAIDSDIQSFWNFAQSTAVSLLCSVQNF